MRAGVLCNREVVIAHPEESIVAAAQTMRRHHVGDLVIVRGGPAGNTPIAILTDRDLVVEVLAVAADRAQELTIADVITRERIVRVSEDADVFEVLAHMRENGVRRIPVVSTAGDLVGILAFDDVVAFLAEQLVSLTGVAQRQARVERRERP
jgi:CBS domain-containing protein